MTPPPMRSDPDDQLNHGDDERSEPGRVLSTKPQKFFLQTLIFCLDATPQTALTLGFMSSDESEELMKSVIGYIRVSTTGQAEDGISLDMQESKIKAYCTLNDLVLSEIISDAGLSGKNLSRPGVQRLLDLIKAGEVSGVVIYSLSRLGRSTSDLLDIAKLMDRKSVVMHSLTEKIDTSTAVGRFFFVLTGALAEMERGLISERTKAALSEKRSQGLRTNYKPPYGHRFTDDGKVVEDNEEQAILRRVWTLGANGSSVREIQRTLAGDGIMNRNGRPFAISAVHYMLKKCA